MVARLSVMAEEALLATPRYSSTWTSRVLGLAATAACASSKHLITPTRWRPVLYAPCFSPPIPVRIATFTTLPTEVRPILLRGLTCLSDCDTSGPDGCSCECRFSTQRHTRSSPVLLSHPTPIHKHRDVHAFTALRVAETRFLSVARPRCCLPPFLVTPLIGHYYHEE